MINEERFWDSAVSEAVRGNNPPDVTARVLTTLAEEPNKPAPGKPRQSNVRILLRVGGRFALAASLLLAIGWLTGLIRWPAGKTPEHGEPKAVASAPDTEYQQNGNDLELKHGWLLVTTGAPDVTCEHSRLTKVDGRVLVHAGSAPTREQAEAVEGWLQANKLEMEMIKQLKRWVQGAGMAALVLTGSAMLDTQRIEAQNETPKATPQWQSVDSVMDIEKLPPDAQWVRGERLDGNYLEFLRTHSSVRGVAFRYGQSMRPENLKQLASMPNLEYLDIRNASWATEPDYSALADMKALKQLFVDYVPLKVGEDGKPVGIASDYTERYHILSSLRTLSDRGVDIHLGRLTGLRDDDLEKVILSLPALSNLVLQSNTRISSTSMKLLAESSKVTSLDLYECAQVEDLGMAYLAKANRLTALTLGPTPSEADLYQVAKMTNLQELTLHLDLTRCLDVLKAHADQLKALTNLKRLRVIWKASPIGRYVGNKYEEVDTICTLAKACSGLSELDLYAAMRISSIVRVIDNLQDAGLQRLGIGISPSYQPSPNSPKEVAAALKDSKQLAGVGELEIRLYNLNAVDEPVTGLAQLVTKFPDLKRLELTIDWRWYHAARNELPAFNKNLEAFRAAHPDLEVTFRPVED